MARILVIDDEPLMRDMLKDLLEDEGYEVAVASNGQIGLQLFETEPADLVVTDLFMPRGGGMEAIRALTKGYPDVAIFAVSGVDSRIRDGLLDSAREQGAHRVFTKPMDTKVFLEAIQEQLTGTS